MLGIPPTQSGTPVFCRAHHAFVGVRFFYIFFSLFFAFFCLWAVSGWCVVCGGIGGLLDVRGGVKKLIFHVPAGGGVTKKGRGAVLVGPDVI